MKIFFSLLIATTFAANGTCPDGDQYCLSCNDTKCLTCAYAVLKDGKCALPTKKVDSCLTYQSTTEVCEGCEENKNYLVSTCPNATISGCGQEIAGICISCNDGKVPAADGKSCTSTACKTTNCARCSMIATLEACVQCKSGFAID